MHLWDIWVLRGVWPQDKDWCVIDDNNDTMWNVSSGVDDFCEAIVNYYKENPGEDITVLEQAWDKDSKPEDESQNSYRFS